ncbi:MAG TPA: hypothetical protein VFX07_04200 [Candidatus Udaeobacter sp.]|jgi:hypothetical protein|nr:hypothetical protein [Candidatus Udaeobacter sp.]
MADTQSARTIAYSHAPFSTWLGVVFLFVLFGLIVFAVIGPSPRSSDYEESRAKKRMERLKALNEETQKDLTTYAWVDKNKGIARIPIDRAMELTVADLAQQKPAPAGPIATPPAQVAPAAAPPAGESPAPASHQQQPAAQPAQANAPAGSPAAKGAASPPSTQPSSPAPASPAPAATP